MRILIAIPSGRGFWAGELVQSAMADGPVKSQSPLVGASGPAQNSAPSAANSASVSIPSGRGFWAGQTRKRHPRPSRPRLNPLWSGLLGRHSEGGRIAQLHLVSIPSGRGFWAGLGRSPVQGITRLVSIPSGRGFWAGKPVEIEPEKTSKVSIPSGRGFWAD